MITPIGIVLEVGQKWREVDPRFERIVTVTSWSQMNEKVQLNGKTWASLKRFNGKRCGYAPHASTPNSQAQSSAGLTDATCLE
jgi:hypothetical protein